MVQLSVNIDHVATVRQARYRDMSRTGGDYGEPDVLRAMHEVEMGGAEGITVHLREDRRHVTDRDVVALRQFARVKFNLEMAATDEMVGIAVKIAPHSAMLVPEGRNEVTTEGGLDVASQVQRIKGVASRIKSGSPETLVSAFIDAEPAQVEACKAAGIDICEVHTGPYALAYLAAGGDFRLGTLKAELDRVSQAGHHIRAMGMRFNAGHALNYQNVRPIAALAGVAELHIGHAIVSRAIYTGLRAAVQEMKRLVETAP